MAGTGTQPDRPERGSPEQAMRSRSSRLRTPDRDDAQPAGDDPTKLELQAQEHYDAWLRAKAEADNIRKRAQADVANAHKYAVESFATELLPVRDSLEAALAVDNATHRGPAPGRGADLEAAQCRVRQVRDHARSTRSARSSIPTATRP